MTTATIIKTETTATIQQGDSKITLSLKEAAKLARLQSGTTTYLGGDISDDEDDDFEEIEVKCSYSGDLTFVANPYAGIHEDVVISAAKLA